MSKRRCRHPIPMGKVGYASALVTENHIPRILLRGGFFVEVVQTASGTNGTIIVHMNAQKIHRCAFVL
jgi:hypothetical protein